MLEANFGKEEYLSVKWVFRKMKNLSINFALVSSSQRYCR